MREVVDADVAGPRVMASLVGGFAALALLVAAVGIYGVVLYAAGQRARETAVRVALGATRASLLRHLLRETAMLAGFGMVVGAALIAAASRSMTAVVGPSASIDALTLAIGTMTMVFALTVASAIPALKAARVDPLRALRVE